MKFQIVESVHEAQKEFDVKQRANMFAIEFSELHPIAEANDSPNYIREKSSIVS